MKKKSILRPILLCLPYAVITRYSVFVVAYYIAI